MARTKRRKAGAKSAAKKPMQVLRAKWRDAVQKGRAVKKELSEKLKARTAEFKIKLQRAEAQAFAKALDTMEKEVAKRAELKRKALAAAEAKFEKRYAKKAAKKAAKRGRGKGKRNKAAAQHETVGQVKPVAKKRGRKAGVRKTAKANVAKKVGRKAKHGRGRPRKAA